MFKKTFLSLAIISTFVNMPVIIGMQKRVQNRTGHWIANHPDAVTALLTFAGAGLGVLSRHETIARTLISAAGGSVLGLYVALALKDTGHGGKLLPRNASETGNDIVHAFRLGGACLLILGATALSRSCHGKILGTFMGISGALAGLQASAVAIDKAQEHIFWMEKFGKPAESTTDMQKSIPAEPTRQNEQFK